MRIAVVSDAFAPRLGGIEVQVGELARRLAAAGHHVEVFTITPDGLEGPESQSKPAVLVRRFASPLPLPGDLLYNPLAREPLRRCLRAGRFDVVHAHVGVLSPFATDAIELAGSLGIPTVITWHSMLPPLAGYTLRCAAVLDRWEDRGARFTAVSHAAAERVRTAARGELRVDVLPNGIDVQRWSGNDSPRIDAGDCVRTGTAPVPAADGASPGCLRLVSAMRLAPIKRPLALLESVRQARLLAPEARITLELVGDGPLLARTRRWIRRQRATGWVRLPGRLPRTELRRRYRRADAYVSPVRDEAFGIAALEARCAGLPVLGLRDSGVAEFVTDGSSGLLVPGDEAMAGAVARLALRPTALARLSRTAADTGEIAARFDWPAVVAATERIYRAAGAGA